MHVEQPGPDSFLGLTDTPLSYSGDANKDVNVNAGETGLEFTADGISIGDAIAGSTSGSVLFVDSSLQLAEDNSNLFWDDYNNELKALNFTGTGSLNWDGSVIFNEGGNDKDFRVEGLTNPNLLFVDASADKIGIGHASPAYALDVRPAVNVPVAYFGSSKTSGTFFNNLFLAFQIDDDNVSANPVLISAKHSSVTAITGSFRALNLTAALQFGGTVTKLQSILNQTSIKATNSGYTVTDTIINDLAMNTANGHAFDSVLTNFYGLQLASTHHGSATGNLTGTNWYQIYVKDFADHSEGTGTVDTMAGLWIDKIGIGYGTTGTVNNQYGVVLNGDGLGSDIMLGAGQDANIYYDGTDLLINPAVVGTGSAKIGDASNYAEIKNDGEINLIGTARVKKEISLNVFSVPKGSSAPSDTLRAIGASGSVKEPVVQFSKVTEQEVHFVFHSPCDLDDSVNVEFHFMWLPGANWTTGNYMWKLEYLVKGEAVDSTTGTPTTISADVTPANANDFIETKFATSIDMNVGEILTGRFYRDVANDNADDVGDARFGEIEYTSNKLGETI